jgi:hypothetical protein
MLTRQKKYDEASIYVYISNQGGKPIRREYATTNKQQEMELKKERKKEMPRNGSKKNQGGKPIRREYI